MYEISNRTDAPYRAICYVVSTWADGSRTRGSGTVVGVNDVLTAMHVVYNGDRGGWATSVTVSPAADTQPFEAPFGSFMASRLSGRTQNWDADANGLLSYAEAQYDLAVIGTNTRLGDVTGWLATQALGSDFYGAMAGYPAVGTGLMYEAVYADAINYYGVYEINSSLGGGASGGPLLYTTGGETYVVGALSGGNGSSSVYAGLHASGNGAWLGNALSANDDLIAGQLQAAFYGTAGNDRLAGNRLDNTLSGGAGNDLLAGDIGNDTLDGGAGLDTAVFTGVRGDYTVTWSGAAVVVADSNTGRDGTDTLTGVERLRFVDHSLALDIDGNAGITALILGAVFGKASLANPNYVAAGLRLLDGGMAYTELVSLALVERLGSGASNEAVVVTLYANVVGVAPPADALAFYTGMLDSGQHTQTTLVVMAAQTPENRVNVDLVGLGASGLAYMMPA